MNEYVIEANDEERAIETNDEEHKIEGMMRSA